jgi:hypothetical protein
LKKVRGIRLAAREDIFVFGRVVNDVIEARLVKNEPFKKIEFELVIEDKALSETQVQPAANPVVVGIGACIGGNEMIGGVSKIVEPFITAAQVNPNDAVGIRRLGEAAKAQSHIGAKPAQREIKEDWIARFFLVIRKDCDRYDKKKEYREAYSFNDRFPPALIMLKPKNLSSEKSLANDFMIPD